MGWASALTCQGISHPLATLQPPDDADSFRSDGVGRTGTAPHQGPGVQGSRSVPPLSCLLSLLKSKVSRNKGCLVRTTSGVGGPYSCPGTALGAKLHLVTSGEGGPARASGLPTIPPSPPLQTFLWFSSSASLPSSPPQQSRP